MGRATRRHSRFGNQRSRHQRRLRLEPLEDRRLLAAGTLYVDADAVGAGSGDSWTDAYIDLQPALAASATLNADADSANDVAEIWIADGTYKPAEQLEADDVRTATFALVSGVSLIGGFAGGETTLAERTVIDGTFQNETVLSGDIGTVDDASDNAYTVVYVNLAAGTESILDGLTITAGNADGSDPFSAASRRYGGGVYKSGSGTLLVTNSTLRENSGRSGGGISVVGGTAVLVDSVVIGNEVVGYDWWFNDDYELESFPGAGGGIYNDKNGTVVVTNSTLSGNSASDAGGGIYNGSDTLTVTNSTISGNSAGHGGRGGGIYNAESGTLTVTNSTISGNSATYAGGGIYNAGTLTVTNSTISTNLATGDGAGGAGGGIYNAGALTVTNSTISGNLAGHGGRGGGIYNDDSGMLMVTNSIVSLNSGRNIDGSFGGSNSLIAIDPGFVRAPSAGADGDWGTDDDDFGDLRLTNRSPAINAGNNVQAVDAAGNPLATDLAGNPRIADGTVDAGAFEYQGPPAPQRETPSLIVSATHDEFDLYDGDVTLREAIYYSQFGIGDGTVTFDASLDGATITLVDRELLIRHSIVIDASALSSVIVDADNRSRVFHVTGDVTLAGLTITGGSATGTYSDGGGIYNDRGTLTVTNSTLSGNSAGDDGGGIYNRGTLTVTNSTLSGNSSTESYGDGGGGIFNSGTLTVTNSTLSENSASKGGGIYNYSGTLTVTNSTLSGNSATSSGGGIYNDDDGTLTVTNSALSGNSAEDSGGIYNSGTLTVTDSALSGNSAEDRGGGIFNDDSGTLTVTNSTLSGNAGYRGGGIYNRGTLTVTNSTLSGNAASTGGGIYNSGTLTVTNSIVARNKAPYRTDIYSSYTSQSSLIGVDPGFVRNPSDGGDGWVDDPDTADVDESANNDYGDLRPRPESPAIDAGNNDLAVDAEGNPLATDLLGNPRIWDGDDDSIAIVDIGAFERMTFKAFDDRAETYSPKPVAVDVLANDRAPDGDIRQMAVTIVAEPTGGNAAVEADGTVTYSPDAGFFGTDSFTYTVADGLGNVTNEATVTIEVVENAIPWQNPDEPLDVDADGFIVPLDVLLIINDMNRYGARPLGDPVEPVEWFLDTDGDNHVAPIDALLILNYLNARVREALAEPVAPGEGEPESGERKAESGKRRREGNSRNETSFRWDRDDARSRLLVDSHWWDEL